MGGPSDLSPPSPDTMTRPSGKRRWVMALKLVLGILIVVAVGRHIVRTWQDLHSQGRSLHLDAGWLAAAVGLYLAGLCSYGVFFWRIMAHSPTPVRLAPALRAYLISHLGKYVPGKAMVVVVRAGLVAPYGARPATAAFATLYETLVMMAAGGFFAAVGFAARPIPPMPIVLGAGWVVPLPATALSLGLGILFLIVSLPQVFPRLSNLLRTPFPGVGPEALPRFTGLMLVEGLLLSAAGWSLLGLSQVAVIRALAPSGVAFGYWPMVLASVALATVSGFAVAVMPGGLGIRELIIMTTLAPAVGSDLAVVAALALRLAWVIGEVLAAALLTVIRPPATRPTIP
jgi:hypothetical protein